MLTQHDLPSSPTYQFRPFLPGGRQDFINDPVVNAMLSRRLPYRAVRHIPKEAE